MRKYFYILIAAVGAWFLLCPNASADDFFQISRLEGHAFVTSSGAPRELRSGDSLAPGDVVRVGPSSNMDLRLHGFAMNTIVVSENTSFTVGPDQAEALKLVEGSMEAQLTKLDGQPFVISTPVAVASVRGTHFLISHADNISQVIVYKGVVEVTSKDLVSGKMRENSISLSAGQKVEATRIGLGPVNEVAVTTKSAEPAIKVSVVAAEKAYYIVSSCKLEDNISSCPDDSSDDKKEPAVDYEDYTMFIGDGVAVPLRASLPWPESFLEISKGNVTLRFEGSMIVCIDYDSKNGKLIAKPFQAATDVVIEYKNGKTTVTWTSRNKKGLKDSRVRVKEGAVAVTTPWMCESCLSTKTFLLEPGDCFTFDYEPKKEDETEEKDFKLPKVVVDPPLKMDNSGSKEE